MSGTAFTGGAVNISGGYHDYKKGLYYFFYCYNLRLLINLSVNQADFVNIRGLAQTMVDWEFHTLKKMCTLVRDAAHLHGPPAH